MKFRIQIDNRKTNSIFILSLAYSRESIGIRLTFSSLLSIFNIKFSIEDPQTYIINFTVRLSEGCHFDYQSRITISYVNNCSAICLKTIRSRGRRAELYTILWKNKREWCLRPNLTRLGFQWHCVKKMASIFILTFAVQKIWFDFLFSLVVVFKNNQLILREIDLHQLKLILKVVWDITASGHTYLDQVTKVN